MRVTALNRINVDKIFYVLCANAVIDLILCMYIFYLSVGLYALKGVDMRIIDET